MYNRCGFFSYKRGAQADSWYQQTKRQLEGYVQAELGLHDYPMFFDRESIPSGSHWRNEIQSGLDQAPILIAFFSVAYFTSPWCMAELKTFMDREDALDLPRGSLIHPATISETLHFPNWARALQAINFQDYYVILPSYWETREAASYSVALREFAEVAVAKVRSMPPYQHNFPKIPPPDQPEEQADDLAGMFAPMGPIPQPFVNQIVD